MPVPAILALLAFGALASTMPASDSTDDNTGDGTPGNNFVSTTDDGTNAWVDDPWIFPGSVVGSGNGLSDVIASWAGAITIMEGSAIPGNPGNIRAADGSFLQNANLPADLIAKVSKYPTWTIQQAMARYLGKPGNPPTDFSTDAQGNPVAYANFVVSTINSNLGTSYTVNTTLGSLGQW